jgi:outer membrane lipoprotein-sorting protein
VLNIGGKSRKQNQVVAWEYHIHDGASEFRFELTGSPADGDIAELEQCWNTAASTVAGKAFVVDLSRLTGIDDAGRQLLDRWHQTGAQFRATSRFGREVAESITGQPTTAARRPKVRRAGGTFLQPAVPWIVALFTLLLPGTVWAASPIVMAENASAPSQALQRYFSSLEQTHPWQSETVEIQATLPKLAKHGRLLAIRRLLPFGKPEYQVLQSDGDRTVRQQVIARYLTAEIQASTIPSSSVAITAANYQFHYVDTSEIEGARVFVFQITPRKKREGLIQGILWIDAESGTALRQTGYFVKKPSIFIKRIDVTRETSIHGGIADLRVTHVALETRLVGRAELTIHERPCSDCTETTDTPMVAGRP